jgi:PST family polysaccharide transporter
VTAPDPERASYRERVVRALAWSVSGQMAARAIAFGFGIALARMLGPSEFGLLAMITVLTQFLVAVADLGLEEALVQRRELDEAHRSSVFWAMLGAGCLLGTAVAAAAPAIARFYGAEELRPLVVLLAGIFLLRGFGTVPRALIARRLDYRTNTAIECAGEALAGACAVALAWRGFGAASLAVQLLVAEAFESALLLWASGWRPRLLLRRAALADLFGFGAYRAATRSLVYWSQHVDDLLIGKLLGSGPLGLYTRAFNLMRLPVLTIARAIARPMFPTLTLIQDDPERVRGVYLRATGAVALATVPLCLGLVACAEPLVVGVFGPQWREAVPLARVLGIAGTLQGVTALAGSLYLSQGRPDLHLRLHLLQNAATVLGVVVGVRWGALGVAVGYTVASVLTGLPMLAFAGRLVGLRLVTVWAHLRSVFLAGAVMTIAVVALGAWARESLPMLGLLALQVAVGGLVYGALVGLGRGQPYRDLLELLRGAWRPARDPS